MDDDFLATANRASDLSFLRPTPRTERPKAPIQAPDAAPAICRICRGEGTAAEPLFYPCKCSGSIKYVHQDCLMEWLAHSQKKYCELCKTSFRFTKLYAPDMPKSLPVHICVEHMARFVLRHLLVWLRAAVTISVWVCWLPYFMRSVWSFMFWVSDEGLGSSSILYRANETDGGLWLSASMADVGTCPASPLLASATTSAAEAAAMLKGLAGEDISEYLVRILLGSLGMPMKVGRSDSDVESSTNASLSSNGTLTAPAASSLLSDVSFLRNLTRSPTLNRVIVTVLEGQIITILVIVCFILVILVRDYVVQQQPEINMRAAFEEPENNPPPEDQANNGAVAVELQREPVESDSDDETLDDGNRQARPTRWEPAATETDTRQADEPRSSQVDTGSTEFDASRPPEPGPSRPGQDSPQAGDENLDDRASVIDYLRIYRRAGGDSERILQIVEEEGLEEKLSYWVDVTRRSITKREDVAREFAKSFDAAPVIHPVFSEEAHAARGTFSPGSNADLDAAAPAGTASKGKETAWLPVSPEPTPEPLAEAGPSRPRAVSDGPRHHDSVNPLGSNNWSFAGLPHDGGVDNSEPKMPSSPAVDGTSSFQHDDLPVDDGNGGHALHQNGTTQAHHHSDDETDDPLLHDIPAMEHNLAEEAAPHGHQEPAGLVGRVANFMWGDLDGHQHANIDEDHAGGDDDAWVDVPMGDGADDNADADAGDIDGAVGAGLDPEAMEDLEDFEGVMELIGMRGPIAGLFQNAIFCAVLVSVTIFACVFIPYNIGRVTVWTVANPMQLVRILFEFSKVVQDAGVMLGGLGSWCVLNLVDMVTGLIGGALGAQIVSARNASWGVWTGAGKRVMEYALMDFPMSASEMQNFSAISHEALLAVKGNIASVFGRIDAGLASITAVSLGLADGKLLSAIGSAASSAMGNAGTIFSLLLDPSSWVIDLSGTETRPPVDPTLAYWSGFDRFWAILAGYLTIFAVSAMYLRRGTPFSRGNMMQVWEAGVIDTLHQASGIMKVILIISIEMLVFPLYCGLLLDGALMPLFENATVTSRILFTYNYPLTSVFVHWFVGTGYMFHFALFVSMCRKIMRAGVLCTLPPSVAVFGLQLTSSTDFIRDPDDPEFHPVRDVLERNLVTQLRKILFSAFVYGALVIVCLGGVVWGLSFTMPRVLPIHYSSNEPVLEFPVDLLFYNFLMPQAVKLFRPSDGLHAMYTWWFRKCARGLRLTYFLFGERRIDEEGTLQLSPDSPDRQSRYRSLFLELDEHNQVIPKTWRDAFEGGDAKPNPPISNREERILRRRKQHLVASGQLVKSGRFVRAPASDRVKIPKGKRVFLTVNELNRRKDGNPDDDIYASSQYQMVYVPPNFRARVFLFILFIWLFAAVTGVGITIAPLALGRTMFKALIPEGIRTNDIYAFSIGIYILGTVAHSVLRLRSITARVQSWASKAWGEVAEGNVGRRVMSSILRGLKLAYAYLFLLVVFPLLFSTMMELYITIPLHTYMNPPTAASAQAAQQNDEAGRHTIRVIQAWTLGLLYLNLGTRMITSLFPDSRAAVAVRTVVRRGWLRPDIGILTRAFVVPGMTIAAVATFGPPLMASFLIKMDALGGAGVDAVGLAVVYRLSYPAAAIAAVMVKNAVGMAKVFKGWKAGIRDEAYLIGERLHNFGAATAGARRAKKAWGAGRPRL
ncbi:ERAD-associated E3 ubiquitin-protein ligase doa10 [Tolypocladium paradoxum]|uniref:RING-type E3 ubiquitin transferase n=1 Tax=Tolypocladium paradoxum TaxID=94208 RepID=A0A2S4KMI0_9HYPO|nr:ERAD-associated E3 ubiquitin-protein ligase doa10 [Tolypocladium paradoxum]